MEAIDQTTGEVLTVQESGLMQLSRSEIEAQVSTAHRFPRSLKLFKNECLEMATLSEEVAQECIFALPRKKYDAATGRSINSVIEGPSARFAEIIASAWGNCRAGARVVAEDAEFVTAEGVFHDLQRNVAIRYEVKRRITDKSGKRFNADMIGVTANAACSIALRNSVLKGVPKAFWVGIYEAAKKTAVGGVETLSKRREKAFTYFKKLGVQEAQICEALGVQGVEDVGIDELVALTGYRNSIQEGESTVEKIFNLGGAKADEKPAKGVAALGEKLKKQETVKEDPVNADAVLNLEGQ